MNKTEQIIKQLQAIPPTPLDTEIIAELRRLAKLNEAYWREIGDWRKTCGMKDAKYRDGGWYTVPIDSNYRMPLSDATDAARREAGEV